MQLHYTGCSKRSNTGRCVAFRKKMSRTTLLIAISRVALARRRSGLISFLKVLVSTTQTQNRMQQSITNPQIQVHHLLSLQGSFHLEQVMIKDRVLVLDMSFMGVSSRILCSCIMLYPFFYMIISTFILKMVWHWVNA